jgi:pantoate--beta-alanine ligase
MKIISTIESLRSNSWAEKKRRVLVPTMGALHAGHVSLIRLARKNAGADGEVVVSIFVNPLQFEPGSDFSRYPRPESADLEICRAESVDLIFRPLPNEMYFTDRSTFVEESALSERLCGASRPGHFRGVCTVVAKLFHLLAPAPAVFGAKDFKKISINSRMVPAIDLPG